jgi:carbonic anhydrase
VVATLEELLQRSRHPSRNLRSIVDRVRPSVEPLLESGDAADLDGLVQRAVRANVRASANQLRHGSDVLEQLIQQNQLLIVGADYSLDTGVVDFFEGVPPG